MTYNGNNQKRRKQQMRRRRTIFFAVLLLLLAAVAVILVIRFFPANDPDPAPDPTPPDSVDPNPTTLPDPDPDPKPLPEPEPEPEPTIFEEDGITYLNLDGVRMLLVNKDYALPADYGAEDPEAAAALARMYAAAEADGITLFTVSGFRSYETQQSTHEYWVGLYGREQAERVSAKPGHSEHQAGLAYDINSLATAFKDSAEYVWLQAHCAEYGFISRYLEGKEWATGYSFEPWHYRYIGDSDLAAKIMASGLSLEEYAELVG